MVTGVLNLGVGNIRSVTNLLRKIGVEFLVLSDPKLLEKVSNIIMPGVGSFDAAMKNLNSVQGLRHQLENKVLVEGLPILGLCLGFHLLTQRSDEGTQPGLGWLDAVTRRLPQLGELKVPNIGWAGPSEFAESKLFEGLNPDFRFFYAHSYYVKSQDPSIVTLRTSYGIEIDSAVEMDNIFGVQFHPEKSHRHGERLLRNFTGIAND